MSREMRHREGNHPSEYSYKLAGKGPLEGWTLYFRSKRTARSGHDFLSIKLVFTKGKIRGAANYWLSYNIGRGAIASSTDTARIRERKWDGDAVISTLEKTSATYLEKVEAGEVPPLQAVAAETTAVALARARIAADKASALVAELEAAEGEGIDIGSLL